MRDLYDDTDDDDDEEEEPSDSLFFHYMPYWGFRCYAYTERRSRMYRWERIDPM